ncbi:MAG: hypothetical protein OEW39_17080, partial [Deltaproteobacteria bacterium]|nr:hypothetical protein [Deltaproteobacteria bacterium]
MRQYIPILRWLQLLLDLAVVQGCFYLLSLQKFEGEPPEHYQTLGIISSLLMIVIYQWQRVYQGFRAEAPWGEARTL